MGLPGECSADLDSLETLHVWDFVDARTDDLKLSLKLYHGCDLRLDDPQLMTEASEFVQFCDSPSFISPAQSWPCRPSVLDFPRCRL